VDTRSSIYIQDLDKETPTIRIEVKHINEREELAYQIASAVLERFRIKTFYIRTTNRESVLGIYCYENGVYRPCESEILAFIEELVEASGAEISKKATRWVVNEAMHRIQRKTLEELRHDPMIIAFRNCLFDWEEFLETGSIADAVHDFDPEIIVFHRIPHRLNLDKWRAIQGLAKYDGVAALDIETIAQQLCPKTLKAFRDWVGEKWILLFEIIGYCMYPRYDLHKAIMLVGEGSNGKSTYLRLIKKILGVENIASVPLQYLADPSNRFAVAELYHKLANIYPDLPSAALRDTGRFKALTGEDMIMAERKHRDPFYFVNYAKLLFSCNELPQVFDMTPAFWRRWIVIEFPNQFPPNPRFFDETFTEDEIEGIIIVSLLAIRNVLKRGKFSFEDTAADYKELWLRKTNSVYAFIRDLEDGRVEGVRARRDINGRVEADRLYQLYVNWCQENDVEPVAKRSFTLEMERLGFRKTKIGRRSYYKGLVLTLENEQSQG